MNADLVELQKCRDSEEVDDVCGILTTASIPYKLGTNADIFAITSIGSTRDQDVIITVKLDDYDAARAALEQNYLKLDLPDDHYLISFSDQELIDLVAAPDDWNPYDVAHAKQLIQEKTLDVSEIEKSKHVQLSNLRKGKPASIYLILFAVNLTILIPILFYFGIVGPFFYLIIANIGIGWSFISMKQKFPHREHYHFDEKSRLIGRWVFWCNLLYVIFSLAVIMNVAHLDELIDQIMI